MEFLSILLEFLNWKTEVKMYHFYWWKLFFVLLCSFTLDKLVSNRNLIEVINNNNNSGESLLEIIGNTQP